jgi:hypothetical protein
MISAIPQLACLAASFVSEKSAAAKAGFLTTYDELPNFEFTVAGNKT